MLLFYLNIFSLIYAYFLNIRSTWNLIMSISLLPPLFSQKLLYINAAGAVIFGIGKREEWMQLY